MASVTINEDGTVSVSVDAQEQALLTMVREEIGAGAFTEVFNLWLQQRTQAVMNTRFARLIPEDQVGILTKMAAARPQRP